MIGMSVSLDKKGLNYHIAYYLALRGYDIEVKAYENPHRVQLFYRGNHIASLPLVIASEMSGSFHVDTSQIEGHLFVDISNIYQLLERKAVPRDITKAKLQELIKLDLDWKMSIEKRVAP